MVKMLLIDYMPCEERVNFRESYGIICVKCEKCGRKFDDGVLINGNEYPGYDPDMNDSDQEMED